MSFSHKLDFVKILFSFTPNCVTVGYIQRAPLVLSSPKYFNFLDP